MFPYLDAICDLGVYLPNFVFQPQPIEQLLPDLEDQFQRFRRQPIHLIHRDMHYMIQMYGETEARLHFMRDTPTAIEALIQDMRRYWALAPYWPQVVTVRVYYQLSPRGDQLLSLFI